MKSFKQTVNYLSSQPIQSTKDWEMIRALYLMKSGEPLKCNVTYSDDGMTVYEFSEWFENGFGIGDIVQVCYPGITDTIYGVAGNISNGKTELACTLNGTRFDTKPMTVDSQFVSIPSDKSVGSMLSDTIRHNLLQFDYEKLRMVSKHCPKPLERIKFKNDELEGVGVVKWFYNDSHKVDFYCYHIPSTETTRFSMDEKAVISMDDYDALPMTVNDLRNLNKALGKFGKAWNDKMHRVELIQLQVNKGEPYWYISDKMTAVKSIEGLTPTSRFRVRAGNYFHTLEECLDCVGAFQLELRRRLAKE